jgi:serine/threonine protein kinase
MPREPSALDIPVSVDLALSGELARGAALDALVFAEGDVIAGKYRVERQLAVGGMGVVYACTDRLLDRVVALKVIHPDIAEDESIRERFLLEARTLARLENPHVTRVFECGYSHGSRPYIVMEFLEGTDLYSVLRERGPLSPERTAHLALQVCRGLADAHQNGIVHRDLKPENLFVTHTERISKQSRLAGRRSLTNPSVNVGSPHYMAPEQVRSPSTVDGRADIWSLGVVIYEVLTGHVPFEGSTLPDLCRAVLTDPIPRLGDWVPPRLAAIVQRCLERDLSRRYADVAELERDLGEFLAEYQAAPSLVAPPATATPSPLETSVVPLTRRRAPSRAQRVLVSLALTVGAAFTTYWSLQTGLLQLPETAPHPWLSRVWPDYVALPPPVELVKAAPAAPAPAARLERKAPRAVKSEPPRAPVRAVASSAPNADSSPKSNLAPRPPSSAVRPFAAAKAEGSGAPLEPREPTTKVPGSLPEVTE